MRSFIFYIILVGSIFLPEDIYAQRDAASQKVITSGLDWLVSTQSVSGRWVADGGAYPTAMTSLALTALLSEGSTTTQGKYAPSIRKAVNFLVAQARRNGLIGSASDQRYTYGHGYAMLALSQVLGEEEDVMRREQLVQILTKAVEFSCRAQTSSGGWGYVSAADGNNFDEGSTTITQVQGLRGCRNAGIPVPKEAIEKAMKYIHACTGADGGVKYNMQGGPGRPAITAAAITCLYNAGDYDDEYVPKMKKFIHGMHNLNDSSLSGFWHYAHLYYAQVMYREGGTEWENYKNSISQRLIKEASANGSWTQGYIGHIYVTSINLIILQMDNGVLPIYQR